MLNDNKKNKRIIKFFDREILKFKLLDDELQIVTDENNEGLLDLLYRIEDFKSKLPEAESLSLSKKLNANSAKQQQIEEKSVVCTQDNGDTEDAAATREKKNPGGWQKKLLREIVKKTHPDKVLSYSKDDQEYYSEICKDATSAYETGESVSLMSLGSDVRIRPKPTSSIHLDLISESIKLKNKAVMSGRSSHGFIWYHLSDVEKETFLINYMAQLGYKINKEEAKAAIMRKRPVARKPGTRPENFIKKRVKKTL